MKAIDGHIYAEVRNGACAVIFTAADHPEWCDITDNPQTPYFIQAIDVTGNVPNVGDLWNGQTFKAPPPPPPPPPPVDQGTVFVKSLDSTAIATLKQLLGLP